MSQLEPISLPSRAWLRSFKHTGHYDQLLVHPDGKRLIAVERLGSVAVWSLADGKLLHSLTAELSAWAREEARNLHLDLHPDGVHLYVTVVIIDCSDVCLCWNLDSGALVATFDYPQVPHHFLDGNLALTSHGLYLSLWSLADGAVRQQRVRDDMSWSMHDVRPEPPYLALVPAREALELWDVERHQLRWSIPGCFERYRPLDDEAELDEAELDAKIAAETQAAAEAGQLGGALFLPGGEILLSRPGALEVRSPDDASVLRTIPCPTYGPLAFHRESQCVVVLGLRRLIAIDLPSGAIRSRFAAPNPESVTFSPDGRHAVVKPHIAQERAVWELATGRCRLRSPLELAVVADTAIALDGAILREWPLGDEARATYLRDPSTYPPPLDPQRCPAGRVAVTASYEGTVRLEPIADAASGSGSSSAASAPSPSAPIEITARNRFPSVLALEPEARRLVIASEDPQPPAARAASNADSSPRLHVLELWRGTSPPLRLHTFRTLTRPLCAAFAPSRRWLVSAHLDGSLHLWDLNERRRAVLADPPADRSPVLQLAISPTSDRLVTFSADHVVRGFSLETLQPLTRWDSEHALYDLRWLGDETVTATSNEGELRLRWPLTG